MGKINMILFSKAQLNDVFSNFGLEVKKIKDTERQYIARNDKTQKCVSCNSLLTPENFGHIAKGSLNLYCDNPSCLTHYVANRRK